MRSDRILFALLLAHVSAGVAAEAFVSSATLKGAVAVKSWKELRDVRVVKQDLDYSCGAASVATIMNGFYGYEVTEEKLLEAMAKDGAASFGDMAEVVKPYGLKGVGVALNFEQLRKLKTPAIAYLRYRDDDHFSVIRGIGADDSVYLAESLPREALWVSFLGQSPFYQTSILEHVGDARRCSAEGQDSVVTAGWHGSERHRYIILWCWRAKFVDAGAAGVAQ